MRTYSIQSRQRGAVLLIMLVIMVVGIAAVLVSSLNSSGLKNARQNTNAAVLVQAKEALIGRAASDPNRPGSLPCPDTNDDGSGELLVGSECPSYVGRLPWKTLGIPDLRDGTGAPLWYALSRNFRDDNSNPINSETLGSLTISGNQAANNIAAIVFAPGAPLCTQSRASNAAVNQYLEAMTVVTATNATVANASNDCASTPYNDQHLAITAAQLIQPVEMRIAREVKACLDNYAVNKDKRYPWAVPTQNWYQSGKTNSQFGRIPYQEPITNNKINDFLDALANLQTKVDACIANDTNTNANALDSAGNTLENAAQDLANHQATTPAIPSDVTTPGKQAGDKAQKSNMCDTINGNPTNNSVQTNLNDTTAALTAALSNYTATSNSNKAVKCDSLFKNSSYWKDWKNLVFYQVDNAYMPGASASGAGSISINGAGNYRATVLVARSAISPQIRTLLAATPTGYLEGGNAHTSSNPNNNFIANRPSDAEFSNVNDLVLCLDGRETCK